MKIAIIQIAPIFLNKQKTWTKLKKYIEEAASNGAKLMTWGETLIPGYPQWVSPSGGAKFNDTDQKIAYAKYWKEALTLDDPIIIEMQKIAKELEINLMGGIAEKNSGSTYATLITISSKGIIESRHRKIKPTYEERLVWADGDSVGLHTNMIEGFIVGGLNCWENWLPYTRAALHKEGEQLHVAIWPGGESLTKDISRFMALEGRYWVISASGILRGSDFSHLSPTDFPQKDIMEEREFWQDGGSMIVNPKGEIVAGPLVKEEGILYATIDLDMVIQERQNLDYSGHYSRPDIFDFKVNKPG